MSFGKSIIGIDIGSISISLAELGINKDILHTAYAFHNGNITETLTTMLKEVDFSKIFGIAMTSSTPQIIKHAKKYDSRISYITAAKHLNYRVGSILTVGGEKFGVALFDDHGDYLSYKSNSSCAAGTGSFLDQQAKRLNLSGIEEFSNIACQNQGEIPKIASRCAVFAKTDLIHAQQEGYSLEAICDGLSYGLAKNIVNTLFTNNTPNQPCIFTGGVSKNRAVVDHISKMLEINILVDEYSNFYGAIGAALNMIEERRAPGDQMVLDIQSIDDIILTEKKDRNYTYQPLKLHLSDYPVFDSLKRYEFTSKHFGLMPPVETDVYTQVFCQENYPVYLGIDIGSTSTKAVLINPNREVIAGFYTRTSGRPVEAVQIIFEALDDFCQQNKLSFNFIGTGTTGSGRKFIGEIIGTDIALDEITAHARAAYEIDKEVDTIIEIGGQDSKFTTLRNGMVTFSIMNNVCAAGTGSFIEEQAKKLNCPLDDYSLRSENVAAPVISDKCTVFMERDLNHYLSEGYSVNEALASALHSVRDNYLTKVAIEKSIGNTILFQGATAKNKSLVAAFEQKLKKPIMVSKYCHLTGALGVALHLCENSPLKSKFRGINLYKNTIPIQTDACELCTNHCKIKIANVESETIAFGFLCGRDYETQSFVKDNPSKFDLIQSRKKIFRHQLQKESYQNIVIGIPAALHLVDELYFWRTFFDLMSIKTITSANYKTAIKDGKKLTGAEFCAPITALHGHVKYLAEKTDTIFLPDNLEAKRERKSGRRHYCYYTQYIPSLISKIKEINEKAVLLNPTLRTIKGVFHDKVQLYKMLRQITGRNISFIKVSSAYDKAMLFQNSALDKLKEICRQEMSTADNISVVLLGRPYTVLSPTMNNKIPEIFAKLGVKTFFQDMLSYQKSDLKAIDPLLNVVHWNYAAKIFEAAEVICNTDGLYPVLITSFKCTPDAFVIDTFKNILDARKKPYLILQLDEHNSNVGYETRIEAGIRAFRNHYNSCYNTNLGTYSYVNPVFLKGINSIKGKTLLFPNFDPMPCKLLEAVFRKEGIDARLLEETNDSIRRSISLNNGQCLPVSIFTQDAIDFIEKNNLDPVKTVVWSIDSNIACNLGVIPHFMKSTLEAMGNGLEKVQIYKGDITFFDLSLKITFNAYFAFMFGGFLKKMGCKTRPYEVIQGSTDKVIEQSMEIFYDVFLNDKPKEEALETVIEMFEAIKIRKTSKPKVAIFGDLYARDNDVLNQNLIRTIEENGGEAITTPYSEYMKMIADPFIQKWFREGHYSNAATAQILVKTLPILEKKYHAYFNRIVKESKHKFLSHPEDILAKFNVKMLHTGESLETILKIFTFISNYPDIVLFVQTSPSLCCPSLITEAMAVQIETITGIPVVNIEYDGTGGLKNEDIIPYLKYPRKSALFDRPLAL